MEFKDMIQYINSELKDNKKMDEIRRNLSISEKRLQKEIKENGYKFNQKLKQYICITNVVDVVVNEQKHIINTPYKDKEKYTIEYLSNNIEILTDMLESYATTKTTTNSTTDIVVDLLDDRHLNPKPKSIRINQYVYEDWQQFCEKNKYYSKQDLISMALKEYMDNHK